MWQAALLRLKQIPLEIEVKLEPRRRNHPVTIMGRNASGLIRHFYCSCPSVPQAAFSFGPGNIFLFGDLKGVNVEFGLNNDPIIKCALAAKNLGLDGPPYKKIRQWTNNSISSADSGLHRWGLAQGTNMPLRHVRWGDLRTISVNSYLRISKPKTGVIFYIY